MFSSKLFLSKCESITLMLQLKLISHSRQTASHTICLNRKLSNVSQSGYIPRRAVLYVPGNDHRKLKKIPTLQADCVVLDCEDGVAYSKKDEARSTIRQILHNQEICFSGKDCSVRFNSIESGLCEEDINQILSSKNLPQTLHLPKVENIDQLNWFAEKITKVFEKKSIKDKLRLILFTESAKSLLSLQELCRHSIELSKKSPFILDGIVFGSDDYCANIGATRTDEASELLYARQHVVTVAKSFNLQAIDLVYINYKDLNGLRIQSEEGSRFGFTGKQVIHPSQIPVVQTAFSPSEDKILWAKGLIEAFDLHQLEGKGAFTYQGAMIDMPLLLQAKNLIKTAEQFKC